MIVMSREKNQRGGFGFASQFATEIITAVHSSEAFLISARVVSVQYGERKLKNASEEWTADLNSVALLKDNEGGLRLSPFSHLGLRLTSSIACKDHCTVRSRVRGKLGLD